MGEQLGVPSAAIMTSEFVSAAELMSAVLGAEDYDFVVIDHPIASASIAELERRAAAAAVDCLSLLTELR